MFNLDDFTNSKYYKQIFEEIKGFQSFHQKSLSPRGQKFEKVNQIAQFHDVIKDYLVSNGFVETFKEVFCEPTTSETIRNYCSNDPTSKLKETCAEQFEDYKPELFNIESRNKIQTLIESGDIDASISLIS